MNVPSGHEHPGATDAWEGSLATEFFVTGGTLPFDALSYVERRADHQLYEAITHSEFSYVLTARQMGKSSLMVRTARRLQAQGLAVAVIDLTALGQNLSPIQWYRGILALIAQQLRLEDELEEHWRRHPDVGPVHRLMLALREVALAQCSGPVVLFVDEIDVVRSLPFPTDEFFAAIRECYNRRPRDPEFRRLTFVLLGVAAPSDLIVDPRNTPFNVGRRIELEDFGEGEASVLTVGLALGSPGAPLQSNRDARRMLRRVLYWTGGHPYLTQRLCKAVADERGGGPRSVDRWCGELFLAPGSEQRDDNLLFVRERLLRSSPDLAAQLELYARCWRNLPVRGDETDPRVGLLRLSGIVRLEGSQLRVRNRIYRRTFDLAWVRSHMPDAERRRQAAAFRRGVLGAGSIGIASAAALGSLAWLAVREMHHSARLESDRREQLIRTLVGNGNRLVESGDVAGSLVWFTEALQWVTPGSAEDHRHRLRLAAAIGKCAQLDFFGRHGGRLRDIAFSGTGDEILTAGEDGTAQVWRVSTGLPLGRPMRQQGWIRNAAFSPNGDRVVTSGGRQDGDHRRGYTRIWNAATGDPVVSLPELRGGVMQARFSPDGQRVVTATDEGVVQVWSAATGRPVSAPLTVSGAVGDVCFSPDGTRIAAAAYGGYGLLWDWQAGHVLGRTPLHAHSVVFVAFSPRGDVLATAALDGRVDLCDARTARPLTPSIKHGSAVNALSFSPDGARIATGDNDGLAHLWEVRSGRPVAPALRHHAMVTSVSFSSDGRLLATGSRDHTAMVWRVADGKLLAPPLHHAGWVSRVCFSPEGSRVASASADGVGRVWKLPPAAAGVRVASAVQVRACNVSADAQQLSTVGAPIHGRESGCVAERWSVATGRAIGAPIHTPPASLLSIAHNGETLLGLLPGGRRAWRQDTRSLRFSPQTELIRQVSWSGDGRHAALYCPIGGERTRVYLWSTDGDEALRVLGEFTNPVVSLAEDGSRILIWAADGAVSVWAMERRREPQLLLSLRGWTPHHPLAGAISLGTQVSLSPDGRWLATLNRGGDVSLRDLHDGRWFPAAFHAAGGVARVFFSTDSGRIATLAPGVDDFDAASVLLWNVPTGTPAAPPIRPGFQISQLCFNGAGDMILTRSPGGAARLWDSATGELLVALPAVAGAGNMAVSANGEAVAFWGRVPGVSLFAFHPVKDPVEQLRARAELLGAARVDAAGVLQPLDGAVGATRWRRLHARASPGAGNALPPDD